MLLDITKRCRIILDASSDERSLPPIRLGVPRRAHAVFTHRQWIDDAELNERMVNRDMELFRTATSVMRDAE
jgi:hypothetical protein